MKKTIGSMKRIFIDSTIGFFVLLVLLTSWVFQVSYIPTSSMAKTSLPGDLVISNKLKYHLNSIRLPIINLEIPLYSSGSISWNKPQNGDVITFMDTSNSSYYLKRLIAKPGDLVFLYNKKLFISFSDKKMEAFFESKKVKTVILKGYKFYVEPYKSIVEGIHYKDLEEEQDVNLVKVNDFGFKEILDGKKYLEKRLKQATTEEIEKQMLNGSSLTKTMKNNLNIIEKFKVNYPLTEVPKGMYFMMGDNRDNSFDSRFFGFVKEEKIIGSPVFTLLSTKNDDWPEDDRMIRTERSFKSIKNDIEDYEGRSQEGMNKTKVKVTGKELDRVLLASQKLMEGEDVEK